ncbi:ribonuclease J [Candidatus Mycoplasma mahonii]|uniref:ribonuclease J n=1 Tax=Candidatus Mycoplasma mahonii TaxID=3004105 RepID=UPI0026EF66B8|nr:ribonuclease J [Candidatus Mycoplasma mahonii]WKX02714.1 ribonuclease J [Candidatus Mycoplasma mahonii]
MSKTKLFTLGGMMEIGKTTIVVEHEDEIVIIDAGIKFTNTMETGVEGIIPDYSYLKENEHKIHGLFITHGHEDHIGGVPYLIQQVKIKKIYAPSLAIAYLKYKLKDKRITVPVEFVEITAEKQFKFKNLSLDFWTSQHSIPDSFGIRVKTPNGNIFDTGDFRFDYTPIGNLTDFTKLEEMAKDGIDVLISDSTNSMSENHSPTEQKILKDIEKIVKDTEGKVIFTTFASNVNRTKVAIDLAIKYKRKVVPFGRSMVNTIKITTGMGAMKIPDGVLIDKKEVEKYKDNEIMILSTGSQGEELAALTRMATGKHLQVKLKHKDVVIFSSSAIPGNRMKIESLINNLYKVGAEIKENKIDGMLHTSGHAYHEEHMTIFNKTKPKYFVPYHGAYRQSAVHGLTAVESGIKKENVFLIENGEVLELENHVLTKSKEFIDPGPIYIDGKNATRGTATAIGERQKLGENGFIHFSITINSKDNTIVGRSKMISRGALFINDSRDLMNEVQRLAHGAALYTIKNKKNWISEDIKASVKSRVEPFFFKNKRRRPVIIVSITDKQAQKNA